MRLAHSYAVFPTGGYMRAPTNDPDEEQLMEHKGTREEDIEMADGRTKKGTPIAAYGASASKLARSAFDDDSFDD